jgi:putative addiction module component (TIGR02574 family)
MPVEQVIEQALKLSLAEREQVVAALASTLHGEDAFDAEWAPEIERRLARYRAGLAKTYSRDEVFGPFRSA